jgi:hypothetical protein
MLELRPEHVVGVLALLIVLGAYRFATRDPRRAHLPPHVRGWPIINQTLIQSGDDPTPYVISWAKKYGEVFRTTSVTQTFVWINSRKAFKELIDRKSAIYASKHPQPFAFDLASGGKRILFMPYGKEWRSMRSIIHQVDSSTLINVSDVSYSLLKCQNRMPQFNNSKRNNCLWIC